MDGAMEGQASGVQGHSATPSLSNQEVDHIIQSTSRSRQRIRKACYPCNKRKIKCDRDERVPCSNCAKRPHPELCTFDDHAPRSVPPRLRVSSDHRAASPKSPVATSTYYGTQTPATQPLLHGIYSAGYNSAPPGNSQTPNGFGHWPGYPHNSDGGPDSARSFTHQSHSGFSSINAPRPFPSPLPLHGTQAPAPPRSSSVWERISPLLPPQKHLLRFFDIYRTTCNPAYPVIADFDEFELAVLRHIDEAASYRSFREELDSLTGLALESRLSWLGLLSAIIAAGIQYSDLKAGERRTLVQAYVKNSMQLLSLSNFLFRPDESAIMALLLIAQILRNDFQPEASWSMVGMVTRMAESMNLQTPDYHTTAELRTREADGIRRRKLWWAILWQESQLTMCFGKPTIIVANDPPASTTSFDLTYVDCMYNLCRFSLDAQHSTSLDRSSFGRSIDSIAAVRQIHESALPRLLDKQKCRTIQDRIEYFAFRIHQGYVVSFLSRLMMKTSTRLEAHQHNSLLQICQSSAVDCLRAYLDMQSFSVVAMRSWTLSFSALSSALLLGTLSPSATGEDDVRELQSALLRLLSEVEDDADTRGDPAPNWSNWYPRALAELEKLCRVSTSRPEHHSAQPSTSGTEQTSPSDSNGAPTNLVQRDTKQDFLDPQILWQKYFSTTSMLDAGSDLRVLPQQVLFGI